MPKKIGLMPFVEEMVETIVNGNISDAVDQIGKLPKRQAMAVAAYVCDQLHGMENYGAFLRRLESVMWNG